MTDAVVLLHGAGRSSLSMYRMARALVGRGYQVYNLGYPSRRLPIEGLAGYIGKQIARPQLDLFDNIHFVTHSLGGIVLRSFLKTNHLPNLGRVVMLAPPNQGSELVDFFSRFPFYDWFLGPVGTQLGTGPDSLPNSLGPVDVPLGIIAGNRSWNPLFSRLIPGPDDGRISVKNTKLVGMVDFIEVPCIHPLIMNYRLVIQECIHFLQQGCFLSGMERKGDGVNYQIIRK